jgi:hypothetical protein
MCGQEDADTIYLRYRNIFFFKYQLEFGTQSRIKRGLVPKLKFLRCNPFCLLFDLPRRMLLIGQREAPALPRISPSWASLNDRPHDQDSTATTFVPSFLQHLLSLWK